MSPPCSTPPLPTAPIAAAAVILALVIVPPIGAFSPPSPPTPSSRAASRASSCASWHAVGSSLRASSSSSSSDDDDDEASRLRAKAEELRRQIRDAEYSLGGDRGRSYAPPATETETAAVEYRGMSLRDKRVLVAGANGRLGSMVCRHLLRSHPEVGEVVAAVHYVGGGEFRTARGWGRLSYEVGAEDGVGNIGAAWSGDRTATFQYTDDMAGYNLRNLRLVEVELLDPVQCSAITEGVDCVVWCATDFNGNKPRAVSGLNVAFLFRALADPTKGRVEVEGLRNILGGLKNSKQSRRWNRGRASSYSGGTSPPAPAPATSSRDPSDPADVVLISASPDAYPDFETPLGTFNGLKREGEDIVTEEFPSLTYSVLRMGRYDDNFVEEGMDLLREEDGKGGEDAAGGRDVGRRRINRRDAARAAVEALTDESTLGKIVDIWTAER